MNALTIHPKVTASTLSGALVLVVLYALSTFGIVPPPEVSAAITLLAGFIGGWLAPASANPTS